MREESKDLLAKALAELRRLKQENAALKNTAAEPIAVVGMACRFPGECADPEAYWNFLAEARSAIRPTPPDRADGMPGTFGSYLDDTDQFDAAFFGISPKEAQSLDPQQRLLLELAWHAFESGNHRPDAFVGRDVGVFVGMSGIDYALKLFSQSNRSGIDPYFGTGSTLSPAAGRLSYIFKFNGPAMVVDTACSSSLVAIHLAVESLRRGECEAALAAGVNRILGPDLTMTFAQSGLLSPDGQCYTFDARAQGYARGEGGGMLLLKRLRDAQAAGDPIFSVILGSAVNQDGGSGGLTMPSGTAQQKVIQRALQVAGLTPADVDYVEAHGTATKLGDPIEANALVDVFSPGRPAERPLLIGSVKTNFGHLEAAAGMASSFKVIQSLRHEALPAHRNFAQPSPHIDWSRSTLRVVEALTPWPRGSRRRVAGVSGFGFAGTNAHVVFAEPPPPAPAPKTESTGPELIVLSARSPEALRAQAQNAAARLETLSPAEWASAALSLQAGRVPMPERLALVAGNPAEAVTALRTFGEKGKARGLATGRAGEALRVAFVFTGQGAQYAGMGQRLYALSPLFHDIVDDCAARLQPELGRDLREVMFAEPAAAANAGGEASLLESTRHTAPLAEIDQTAFTQAGLFVIEYALARLWQSWGIRPQVVLGHSVGEYAAACIAGVFSVEDALRLIAARGRLMQERSAPGAMLTVFADEAVVAEMIAPFAATVSVAAVNGPEIVLVSGAAESIEQLHARFEAAQLRVVRMRISHAFHSPLTEPVLDEIKRLAGSLRLSRPDIPLISNVTGALVDAEIATPEYWARHLRQSVRFCESMTLLHAQRLDYFIEIGPEPTLLGLDLCFRAAREQSASKAKWLPSLRRGYDDWRALLDSAGRLWAAGAALDWSAIQVGRPRAFVSLPVYPYQRKRHWFKAPEPAPAEPTPAAPSLLPMPVAQPSPIRLNPQDILAEVQAIIGEVSGIEPADLPLTANLLEMGLDSLMFVRAGRVLEKRFQVKISVKQFYEELHRIGPLVDFLAKNAPADALTRSEETAATTVAALPAPTPAPAAAASVATPTSHASATSAPAGLDPVWHAHFELMQRYLQMQAGAAPAAAAPTAPAAAMPKPMRVTAPMDSRMAVNFGGLNLAEEKNLSPQQKEFLRGLTERLTAKTRRSKEQTQAWRKPLADWKGSLQFKRSLKELKYPIVSNRAAGSRIWDIDGNEYVDLALGMGVHFLGHAPAFINEALHRQIERTAALGPQSDLAGEVARKICQLTGTERASLAITGSGAVMLAQRLARAATGRPLIAQFAGAYHGIGSEVLVVGGEDGSKPLSPGIPRSVVENAQVLDYGSDESLEWIREHAAQLAAVIVEPVQSRRPGFQPHRFLRRLRRLTAELDIALIFDEMINGFRIHAGGAQAWFGIEADIVTYGKIVGGGLPLAVVAGKARFLDWIDGGFWQYGDDSTPTGRTIFTGGTHNRHPLALAAANAALDHLIAEGPALHEAVNRRTERLAKELNAFFEAESVSIRAAWFGSQFRFEALGDPFELEVLFYLLTEMGFYTWEQRICCLSTAHADEDIDRLVEAVRRGVAQMRAGGFALLAGPGAPRRVLPLSSVQERLFALCQREGAEMPYHLSGVWEMRGPIDAFRLQDAFQEIIRRHESLRTAFGLIAGKPCQYIIDEPRFFLETIDAAGRSPEAVLQAFIRPFDLERPPLLRVGYAPLESGRSLLLIDVHHIAADGLSMNVILQEFTALYDGRPLRPVRRQYRHAIEEVRQARQTPAYREQEAYWLKELAGELPVLELPTDFPRSGEMDFRGDKCMLVVDPERTRRLEVFAREQGASLYMVLLGAFAVLLHRLAEAEDLIVGLPVAGRPGADNDEVVGMFVNSLPLRFRPGAEQPFVEFLQAVRSTCLGAYDHADYAFGDLVERLNLPRNPDRNPVFDTMFAYENADERVMRTRELEIRTVDQFEGSGMFDFNVDIIREAGALNVRFHYATRLFERQTAERWSGAYGRLLDAILTRPRDPVGRLPLLSAEEHELVTTGFNAVSGAPRPAATLISLWEASVQRHPHRHALGGGNRLLTYHEADERANAIAARLARDWGVARGDRVALCVEASVEMVVAVLGILKAGAAYVPIDPANPRERVGALIEDCGARLLVADIVPDGWQPGVPVIALAELASPRAAAAGRPAHPPAPGDLAYIIYTSGSTGQPKGVMIEHGGIANALQWRRDAYPFNENDVTLLMPSYAFDASVLDLFGVFLGGGRLVPVTAAEKRDLAGQAERLRQEKVTNLLLTPSLHALYLQEIAPAMIGLRWVCVAGEATTRSLLRRHFERLPGVRLFNEYGPTENSVVSTFTELFPDDSTVTIGRPVAGHRLHVLQKNGEFCGIGVPGELVVSGPGLARGYLNRPELTAAAFTAAPWEASRRIYRTGDRVRWRPDGTLEFLGRRDGQVKLHGYRIELEEIEELLRREPGVASAAVKLVPIAGEPQLVAYVAPADCANDAALRAACQATLPVYMTPTIFVRLAALPLNQSGKVDRRALPVPEIVPAAVAGEPPQGERETLLAGVWQEVLRQPFVGRDDDYFRLGGDSIKGIQIISRLLQRGWRLDMRWLFRYPTVAGLAPHLEETRGKAAAIAAEETGEIPLGPIQQWFFATFAAQPAHFNQGVWLDARGRWSVEAMASAWRSVVAGHDAFRYRFSRDGEAWRQRCVAGDSGAICRIVDLRGAADSAERMNELVRAEQTGLDLEKGPVTRAMIVRLDGGNRLLWTAHHLVVDGVSWRILLEDLANAYAALSAGRPAPAVNRTVSFGRWTKTVRAAVGAGKLQDEIPYWRPLAGTPAPRLPHDSRRAGSVADLRAVSSKVGRAAADRLLREASAAFRTRGVELFVSALRLAYTEWNPGEALALALEGHGREAALCDLDVSRTVGWFTSAYPVRFDAVSRAGAEIAVLRETKDQLRRIPRQGAGFGWLRALNGDPDLATIRLPEISFNYLGSFDERPADAAFDLSAERPAQAQDPRHPIVHPVSLYGYLLDGELHWTIEYDSARLPETAVRGLLDRFVAALERIGAQAMKTPALAAGPSDFVFQGLSLEAFDRLVERCGWAADAVEDIYPLSPMQRGLYYEALKAPDSEAYFEQMAFRLDGRLELESFRRAWKELVARHAALRSVFVRGEGSDEVLQVVLRSVDAPFTLEDISARTAKEQRARIEVFKREDRTKVFDLATGPLVRLHVFALGGNAFTVVWSHHHIVMDGWCVGILYEDLMRLHEAYAQKREPRLEAPADYRDYLRWLGGVDRAASADFWRRELEGYDRMVSLPRQQAAGAADYRCRKRNFELNGAAWTSLQALAAGQGATTATLLQTLWGVLLARYNQTDDLVFGSIVSGRPENVVDVERMVGLFINALPVRFRFEREWTLADALRHFQLQAIERRAHEYLPLAEIAEQGAGMRELFDHLVVLENYPMEEELRGGDAGDAGARARPRLSEIESFERTHFDFTLVAVPRTEGLDIELTYNEAVYSDEQIARVESHFTSLVTTLAAQPAAPCLAVDFLPATERRQLEAWNATSAAYPADATIVSLFDEQAAKHAQRRAVTSGGASRTYAEIEHAANALAGQLHAAGVRTGDRVAIWLPRNADMVVALLGTLKAGGCYVPLDPEYPEERLRFILEDSAARVVIAHSGHRSPFAGLTEVLIDAAPAKASRKKIPPAKPEDPAYVIYTSGSTGRPKGCLISHRNVVRLLRNDRFDFQFGPDDVWVVAHSFCFDFSVWELYGALLNGGRVVVAPREEVRDIRSFVDLIARERVTVLNQTPAAFYAFLDEALTRTAHDFSKHLRYVIFGGDRLEPHYLAPWTKRYGTERPALINMYGITETTVHVTFHQVSAGEIASSDGRSVIGRPLPETEVWVLDAQRRLLPIGVPGELYVGGTGVGLGYLNRAELTAERFLPDPRGNGRRLYRTGDVGRWREDGKLEYLGRNDHQVQVRGFRVELGEVEVAFLAQAGIEQAVVLPLEETPGQIELVAYLVGEQRGASELRTALAGRLPQYMIPGYIEWLPAIPLTGNGKIDRKALPRPGGGAAATAAVAPRDATETALLGMWREVLGIETIGIHDNFFDLGGHSLKAVRLRAKIEDGLKVSISLRDLFTHSTIAGLAALVAERGGKAASATGEAADLAALMAELSPEELEAQLDKLER